MDGVNQFSPIILAKADVYVAKAKISRPVKTSFGYMNHRASVIVRLEDKDGAYGWGEVWCNFPNGGEHHRAFLLTDILLPLLSNDAPIDVRYSFSYLTKKTRKLMIQCGEFGPISQAIAGIDLAIWDLIARKDHVPIYSKINNTIVKQIPVYASGINPDRAWETVNECRQRGFRAFKLKIGFGTDIDLQNIRKTLSRIGHDEKLMLDVNQAWDVAHAKSFVQLISDLPIHWIEEPLAADSPEADWAELSSYVNIPIAAGENIQGIDNFTKIIDAGHVGVIQPDVCKWGGITGCLEVANIAIKAGKMYCPHYLGGGIGLLASAHVLAAVGGNGMLEVDQNPNPLREGLSTPFPKIKNGLLTMPTAPGLGVEPDFGNIRKYIVTHKQIKMQGP